MVFNYSVKDPEKYRGYGPAAMPTLAPYGAEIVVADFSSDPVEGAPGHVTVVVRWPSKEAARAWYDSPEYQLARDIRTTSAEGIAVLCDGFNMPA